METVTIILTIFAITYIGIAIGRIPGLRLNRAGIALLGAIGLVVFGGVTTRMPFPTSTGRRFFCSSVFLSSPRNSDSWDSMTKWPELSRTARTSRALSARLDGGDRRAFRVSQSRHRLLRLHADCRGRASAQALNPVPFLIALAVSSNIGAASTLIGNPQDMMIGQVAHLDFGRYMFWTAFRSFWR